MLFLFSLLLLPTLTPVLTPTVSWDLLSVGESMGGTMGGVLQIFFSAGEASLAAQEPPRSAVDSGEGGGGGGGGGGVDAAWCRAFVAGVEGVEFYGGAKAGMRTVLDAVVPAAKVLEKKGPSGGYFFWRLCLEGGCGGGGGERGKENNCGKRKRHETDTYDAGISR